MMFCVLCMPLHLKVAILRPPEREAWMGRQDHSSDLWSCLVHIFQQRSLEGGLLPLAVSPKATALNSCRSKNKSNWHVLSLKTLINFEYRLQAASLSKARLPSIAAAGPWLQPQSVSLLWGWQRGAAVTLPVSSRHFLYCGLGHHVVPPPKYRR